MKRWCCCCCLKDFFFYLLAPSMETDISKSEREVYRNNVVRRAAGIARQTQTSGILLDYTDQSEDVAVIIASSMSSLHDIPPNFVKG